MWVHEGHPITTRSRKWKQCEPIFIDSDGDSDLPVKPVPKKTKTEPPAKHIGKKALLEEIPHTEISDQLKNVENLYQNRRWTFGLSQFRFENSRRIPGHMKTTRLLQYNQLEIGPRFRLFCISQRCRENRAHSGTSTTPPSAWVEKYWKIGENI